MSSAAADHVEGVRRQRAILPVTTNPSIRAYQPYAYPVSIVEAHVPENRDWILSNFIHLAYDEHPMESPSLCFYSCDFAANPHLRTIRADREWMQRWIGRSFAQFVHAQLLDGWYVYAFVDEFFVPRRPAHGRSARHHDVLVHGSDSDAEIAHLLGYDEAIRFDTTQISWTELDAAYESCANADHPWSRAFILFKFDPLASYRFDPQFVIAELELFLASGNPGRAAQGLVMPDDRLYGVAALEAYRDELLGTPPDDPGLDLHAPRALFEHSRLMSERLRALLGDDLWQRHVAERYSTVLRFYSALPVAMFGAKHEKDHSALRRLMADYPEIIERQISTVTDALDRRAR
ncbi:hypothetical protein ACVDFE_26980 [Lentzea chajnantorensis]